MGTANAMLSCALAYAGAGYAVLPLAARGKAPVTAHGKDDATVDPTVIRAWWTTDPWCNIGIRLPAGVVVLDVDPRAGGRPETLGRFPATWTAATGGGGWHVWFRFDGEVRGRLAGAVGVDIKSHTGYVVVPPSVHPSGKRYRWINEASIGPLPEHLRAAVARPAIRPFPGDRGTSGVGLLRYVERAQPGHRNSALFWAAARAYAEGADRKLLHDLVVAAAGIGLSAQEIERTMRSAEQTA